MMRGLSVKKRRSFKVSWEVLEQFFKAKIKGLHSWFTENYVK
jgi:hypothetical protein